MNSGPNSVTPESVNPSRKFLPVKPLEAALPKNKAGCPAFNESIIFSPNVLSVFLNYLEPSIPLPTVLKKASLPKTFFIVCNTVGSAAIRIGILIVLTSLQFFVP